MQVTRARARPRIVRELSVHCGLGFGTGNVHEPILVRRTSTM